MFTHTSYGRLFMPQQIWSPSPVVFTNMVFNELSFFRKVKLNEFRPMYTKTFDDILHAKSVLLLGDQNDYEKS